MADNISTYIELLEQLQATTAKMNMPIAEDDDELAIAKEHMISVDWNTRVVKLPSAYSVYLSVATDHRAATVYFEADRYYDGVDLLQRTFAVEYVNASGEGRVYPVIDFDTKTGEANGKIIFGWKIGHDITKTAGEVKFMVHVFQVDPDTHKYVYSLHTQPCSAKILKTLDIDEQLDLEDLYGIDAEEVQQLFSRIQILEQKAVVWNDLEGEPEHSNVQQSNSGGNNQQSGYDPEQDDANYWNG